MFKLERTGFGFWRKVRLVAPDGMDGKSFDELGRELGTRPRRARKTGRIAARQATAEEHVETRWNGKETQNTAQPGDWVVTALAAGGAPLRDSDGEMNVYVIKAQRFPELYERASSARSEVGDVYDPKGVVDALRLTGGFEIKAPWGETQQASSGYLLRNGNDVYGNNRETFEASYQFVD